MKLDPTLKKNLNAFVVGRARIKLFTDITGKVDVVPSEKQRLDFVMKHADENLTLAEFYKNILTGQGRHKKEKFNGAGPPVGFKDAFRKLEKFPVDGPVFIEFTCDYFEEPLCAYIKPDELLDDNGYLYTIIIFNDNDLPSMISIVRIAISATLSEPSLHVLTGEENQSYSKDDSALFDNSFLTICLHMLVSLADTHVNNLVPYSQVSDPDYNLNTLEGLVLSEDKTLKILLQALSEQKALCYVVEIPLSQVVPHSYTDCFKIPLYLIELAETNIQEAEYCMLVYQQGDHFVMSDSYPAYLAFRKLKRDKVNVVVLGTEKPKNVTIISTGGAELIPPLMATSTGDYDSLDDEMKELILQKYVNKLSALGSAKNLIDTKCIVLTEDSGINILETFLEANNFNLDETLIFSYKNCTNLDSLDITIGMIRKINPNASIIIHRDRDYLVDSEIEKIIKRIELTGAFAFVTDGTDIESYYINAIHLVQLYPNLTHQTATQLIDNATEEGTAFSIEKIKKHEHGAHWNKASHLDGVIHDIFNKDKERYRHGKKTLGLLTAGVQKKLQRNVNLIQPTDALMNSKINGIAQTIWPYLKSEN